MANLILIILTTIGELLGRLTFTFASYRIITQRYIIASFIILFLIFYTAYSIFEILKLSWIKKPNGCKRFIIYFSAQIFITILLFWVSKDDQWAGGIYRFLYYSVGLMESIFLQKRLQGK